MKTIARLGVLICLAALCSGANAHPGRTAADGCHNDRKNGGRHCHGGGTSKPAPKSASNNSGQRKDYYRNCSEARAAGVTPLRRGQPGYGKHLDRDGDGKACE